MTGSSDTLYELSWRRGTVVGNHTTVAACAGLEDNPVRVCFAVEFGVLPRHPGVLSHPQDRILVQGTRTTGIARIRAIGEGERGIAIIPELVRIVVFSCWRQLSVCETLICWWTTYLLENCS